LPERRTGPFNPFAKIYLDNFAASAGKRSICSASRNLSTGHNSRFGRIQWCGAAKPQPASGKEIVMSRTSTAPTSRTATVFRELPADKTGIRPLRMNVPQEEVAELRQRIHATRWPDRETVR
jgi:hypothetical protein